MRSCVPSVRSCDLVSSVLSFVAASWRTAHRCFNSTKNVHIAYVTCSWHLADLLPCFSSKFTYFTLFDVLPSNMEVKIWRAPSQEPVGLHRAPFMEGSIISNSIRLHIRRAPKYQTPSGSHSRSVRHDEHHGAG